MAHGPPVRYKQSHSRVLALTELETTEKVTILDRFPPAPPIELVHHARDDLHAAATMHRDPPCGTDFAAYGSALTGAVAALGSLTANLLDELERETSLIRPTQQGSATNEAIAHLSYLRTLLNAGTNASCEYWIEMSKADPRNPGPAPPSDPYP